MQLINAKHTWDSVSSVRHSKPLSEKICFPCKNMCCLKIRRNLYFSIGRLTLPHGMHSLKSDWRGFVPDVSMMQEICFSGGKQILGKGLLQFASSDLQLVVCIHPNSSPTKLAENSFKRFCWRIIRLGWQRRGHRDQSGELEVKTEMWFFVVCACMCLMGNEKCKYTSVNIDVC